MVNTGNRPLQFNNNIVSSSDYINRKKNRENLKFARNNFTYVRNTHLYTLECNLKSECYEKKPICFNSKNNNLSTIYKFWKPEVYIATYQNYSTMINLLLEQATLNSDCYRCGDVPNTLYNGLTSEICYNDYFKKIYKSKNHCFNDPCDYSTCNSFDIKNIDLCKSSGDSLYPYGNFNNNNPDVTRKLRHRLILNCHEKMPCPTYIYCKCPPDTNDCFCKCCDYTIVFPFKDTFIKYVVSRDDKNFYELINNPTGNKYNNYNSYLKKLNDNNEFKKLATHEFGQKIDFKQKFDFGQKIDLE